MRQLIPESILDEYKVLFLSIPGIDEWHLTKIDFSSLPAFCLLNHSIRTDYITPVFLYENEESGLLVMDKVNNHSLYSLMITQSGKTPKKGFQELSEFEMRNLFEVYTCFIDWCTEKDVYSNGLLPRFSYNHDPYTVDRPGLQSIERFHAHLYLLQQEDLAKDSYRHVVMLKDLIFSSDYKDFFDPAAYCFEKLLLDLHRRFIPLPSELKLITESLVDKVKNGRGLGLNILYKGPVDYFKSKIFLEYICSLHLQTQRFFSDVVNFCFDHSLHNRVDKNKIEDFIFRINWISEETKTHLKILLNSLKELPPNLIFFLQKRQKLAKNLVAYRSLCYSFSIDLLSPNEYLLNFYPRLFSEIGGAGIFACSGYNAVVIDRNKKSFFIPQKIEERRVFQREFLQKLKSNLK